MPTHQRPITPLRALFRWSGTIAILAVVGVALQANAQSFVEPPSNGGGSTAWPLNSSANTQYKRGSLLIGPTNAATCNPGAGDTSGCARLCLNSSNPNDLTGTSCIYSWDQLRGQYVHLQSLGTSTPSSVLNYGTPDLGFARVRASGASSYSFIAEANPSPASGSATAIYATDSGLSQNYAAQFNGRVYVGYTPNTSNAKLCLNSTLSLSSSLDGRGCISSWSDLAGIASAGNYVVVQPAASIPTAQTGQIAVSGTGSFAQSTTSAVVIGAPAAGSSIAITCGDSMCNGVENNTFGSSNYCPSDCDRSAPPMPSTFAYDLLQQGGSATYYTATLNWEIDSVPDIAGFKLMRKASGYVSGPTDSADWVRTVDKNTSNVADPTHLNFGTYYYYTVFAFDATGNYSVPANVRIFQQGGDGCVGSGCGGRRD